MFWGHRPSLLALDETPTPNIGQSVDSGWFVVTGWCFCFSFLFLVWGEDFQVTVHHKHAKENLTHHLSLWWIPSSIWSALSLTHLLYLFCSDPSDNIVLLHNMVYNCRFFNCKQRLFSTCPGENSFTYFSASVLCSFNQVPNLQTISPMYSKITVPKWKTV